MARTARKTPPAKKPTPKKAPAASASVAPKPEIDAENIPLPELQKRIALLKRQKKAVESRTDFMTYIKFTMPDPEDPNDATKSAYEAKKHHRAVARAVQNYINGVYDADILILLMPPRHGKSEIVSRRLPAWFSGRYPRENIVVATYNDDFAADFGADVRTIVQTPQHKLVFPTYRLKRGGSAKDRLQTEEGGMLMFVGRGGSLTGRGAHCFVSGTEVWTADGSRQIQTLRPGDQVLAYEKGRITSKRVQAVSRRTGARIFRITTAAGRVVESTGDHPFFVSGRWVDAAELTPGDPLLCAVRPGGRPTGVRCQEAPCPGADGLLLLQPVLGEGAEPEAVRGEAVRAVRRPRAQAHVEGCSGERPTVLLGALHAGGAAGGVRGSGAGADEAVPTVQRHVSPVELRDGVLLESVRVEGALGPDSRGQEPAVEGRGVGETVEAARRSAVSRDAPARHEAGWAEMRPVLGGGHSAGSPPHRREPAEQPRGEPRDVVPALPLESAPFAREGDFVLRVEDTGRVADVFDIQVEGAHNFFAEGILVHNCLIGDDLIKDDKEASSQAIRDQAWNWLTRVAMTRRMGRKLVILTFTRWHADDPIGRLTDPENEYYSPELAKRIKIINLPALAEDDDPLERKPGEALWPERFDEKFLSDMRLLDPIGFSSLYQQRPTVEDGILFRREFIRYYDELPEDLRYYAASDHAVATGQRSDRTALIKVGVDRWNNIYVTDVWWKKAPTNEVVEAMLAMGKAPRPPVIWWAEKGHISKSIGPFLRKRMDETASWFNISEVTPSADKEQRAQAISARLAMGHVLFPRDAWWTEKAVSELLAFPNGLHDDFVDAMAYIGLGLRMQVPAEGPRKKAGAPQYGTLGWIKEQQRLDARADAARKYGGF